MNNSTIDPNDPLVDQIYSALHPDESKVCIYGNTKGFSSIHNGFKFCGRAGTCQCAKESVSASVSASKALFTDEQIQASNAKRVATLQEKYDVDNAGKLPQSKENHKQLYDNKRLEKEKDAIPNPKDEISDDRKALYVGYNQLKSRILTDYNMELLTPFELYNGCTTPNMSFVCKDCNTILVSNNYTYHKVVCKKCHPPKPARKSIAEQEVYDYVTNELNISNGIQQDRTIIKPLELDMVFPDQMIAVEYCGLYYHSENNQRSPKHKMYHMNKMKLANDAGYKLITIFEDEWLSKKEIVKTRLKHIFGKSDIKYYARKLKIEEISNTECRAFLNLYHIQGGKINADFSYALKDYSDNIVAVMTFSHSKNRKFISSKNKVAGSYELVRYATNGSNVIGGASKLLSHFVKMIKPETIISYADLRWSEGNLYKTLGFTQTNNPKPGYWYVLGSSRYHRFNFSKSALVKEGFDPNKTEEQIMFERGYDRIWDCGQLKFEKKFNKELNETQ